MKCTDFGKKNKRKKGKKRCVSGPWHQVVSLRLNQLPSSAIFKKKSKEKLKISLTKYENSQSTLNDFKKEEQE